MYQFQLLIRKQLSAGWRYRWPAVFLGWLVCAVGWVGVMKIPNTYEADARLYIDADAILTPLLRGISMDSSLQAQVDLLSRTLMSRPNLEKLVSKTDLNLQVDTPAEKQALVARLSTDIKLVPQTRNLFVITYRNENPKLAYDIVQAMLTGFVEGKAGNNRSDLENANRFIESQLSFYERQLRDAERRRAEFRTRYTDLLPGDTGTSRLQGAVEAVRALSGQIADAQARRVSLAKELAGTPPLLVSETVASSGGGGGSSRLAAEEQKLSELRLRLTDAHPDIIAQRQVIAALRAGKLGRDSSDAPRAPVASSPAVPNPVYEQLKVRLVDTDASISSLQRQLADATKERDRLDAVAKTAPGLQADALNLDRDYGVLQTNYSALLARRESMRISAAAEANADQVKIQVIEPPLVPTVPVAPQRTKLITGVLVAGLAAGIGLALLLVQLDQSFHTTDDLRDLGYPVMGGVSFLGATVPLLRRLVTVSSFACAIILPCLIYGGLLIRLIRSGSA
jgi:polysaccharide chain length determinant protein (PEP-CTERM system associated)